MTFRSSRAAMLAAAGAVLVAVPAFAVPVYTSVGTTLNSYPSNNPTSGSFSQSVSVDVNNDGQSEFSLTHTAAPALDSSSKTDVNGKLTLDKGTTSSFIAIVKDTDGIVGDGTTPIATNVVENFAEALTAGSTIGPGRTFIELAAGNYDNRLLDASVAIGTNRTGAFSIATGELPGTAATSNVIPELYVGFAFGSLVNPNYGYLKFTNVDSDNTVGLSVYYLNRATLAGFAYETTPGLAITIPEPMSIGSLALGGMALLGRRRKIAAAS